MTVNGRAPNMSESLVRQGIMGLLDPNLLATVGAGGGATDRRAAAQLSSPSDPGYTATAPAPIGRTAALDLLRRAGFVPTPDAIVTSTPSAGASTTSAAPPTTSAPTTSAPAPGVPRLADAGGTALRFVIGAVENDDIALAVAGTAADELVSAGIDATVTPLPADELYSTALTDGGVDAVVGWTSAGVDPATAVVLEDSPSGIASGHAAGCAVVAVPSVPGVHVPTAPRRLVTSSLLAVDLARLRDLVAAGPADSADPAA